LTAVPFASFARAAQPTVSQHERLRASSRWLRLAEGRAVYELGFTLAAWPLLLRAPRGDGHTVLVLPGLLATDLSTAVLRGYLAQLGYDVRAWELGRNLPSFERRSALAARVDDLFAETGAQVSLVGWSLGGIYARDLARTRARRVRSAITLGSPLAFEPADRITRDPAPLRGSPEMPFTSIYSKSDGVVDWRRCLVRENARSENIAVTCASHLGLGVNAAVLWATADRLAQPEGLFTPFDRGGPFGLAYGPAHEGA